MKDNDNSKIDQLLDLLLDALQERQAARSDNDPAPKVEERPRVEPKPTPEPPPMPTYPYTFGSQAEPTDLAPANEPEMETAEEELIPSPYIPEKLPTIHLDRLLGRLSIFIFALIIVVNIPLNRYGTNLARALPDVQSLVIRDGLVLKGSGDRIYVLQDNHKRWISSLDAFQYYGYTWQQVNIVDDDFLDQFPTGPALSILRRCSDSPHVFAIENGVKRWIKDIPTFVDLGYVWEDVQVVSCPSLRAVPDGLPIPENAGEPPVP